MCAVELFSRCRKAASRADSRSGFAIAPIVAATALRVNDRHKARPLAACTRTESVRYVTQLVGEHTYACEQSFDASAESQPWMGRERGIQCRTWRAPVRTGRSGRRCGRGARPTVARGAVGRARAVSPASQADHKEVRIDVRPRCAAGAT